MTLKRLSKLGGTWDLGSMDVVTADLLLRIDTEVDALESKAMKKRK